MLTTDLAATITKVSLPSFRVDDSLILLDREGGYCYALNSTSARIWALISESASVASVCDTLCREFAVDRDTCEREVIDIIEAMRKAELVR